MAELTNKQYLDLAGLKVYDGKIKGYVDNAVDTLDSAINGVNGTLTAEIANRQAGDKAINDKLGDLSGLSEDGKATVADLFGAAAAALAEEATRAKAAEKANADAIAAINNGESGVLASAKAYTDTKVGEEKTRAEGVEATLDAAIKAETSRATSAEGTLQSNIQSSLEDAKAYTDTEVGKEKTRAEAAEKAINDNIGAWDAFDDEATITEVIEAIAGPEGLLDGLDARIKVNEEAIGTWDPASFGDKTISEAIALLGETFSVDGEFISMADVVGFIDDEKERAEAAEAKLTKDLSDYEKETDARINEVEKSVQDHHDQIDEVVSTLVGTDEGKSVRKIANEELAAQLLSGDADADFKTLQELAAWLEAHPESVAEMNAAIAANAKAISDEAKRAGDAETALDGRLDLVEAAVGQGGNVDARIEAAINALDSTAAHTAGADGLALNVAIVDGKLTSISGSIAANTYDAHGSASTAESNAKSYTDTELAKVYAAMESIPNSEIEALFA